MADLECFDVNPDPTFQADKNPDPAPDPDLNPNPFTRVRNCFLKILSYCFQSLPKLVMCNFLSKNAGGRVRGEG